MELWDLQRTKETVIGFGAISGKEWTEPLTESNILTITNRTWADIHLSEFAVAIQLPEEVVRSKCCFTSVQICCIFLILISF